MKHPKSLVLSLMLVMLAAPSLVQASDTATVAKATTHRSYKPYVTPSDPADTRWASAHGPWDFSGLLGLYNPGFGFGARAAYRFLDSVLENVDDSMSFETGLNYVSASDSFGGQNVSYSLVEIPLLARWDFRINNSNFIAGPEAGFTYVVGNSVTVNGINYSVRNGVYFLLGGFGMYKFNDNWAVRLNLNFGGYTVLALGATYFF